MRWRAARCPGCGLEKRVTETDDESTWVMAFCRRCGTAKSWWLLEPWQDDGTLTVKAPECEREGEQ